MLARSQSSLYNEFTKAVGLVPRHLAFKAKVFILCSIAEAIVSVQWFFWLSSFCFSVLKAVNHLANSGGLQ